MANLKKKMGFGEHVSRTFKIVEPVLKIKRKILDNKLTINVICIRKCRLEIDCFQAKATKWPCDFEGKKQHFPAGWENTGRKYRRLLFGELGETLEE